MNSAQLHLVDNHSDSPEVDSMYSLAELEADSPLGELKDSKRYRGLEQDYRGWDTAGWDVDMLAVDFESIADLDKPMAMVCRRRRLLILASKIQVEPE